MSSPEKIKQKKEKNKEKKTSERTIFTTLKIVVCHMMKNFQLTMIYFYHIVYIYIIIESWQGDVFLINCY